jgi:Glyoxalase-like domain
MLRFGMAVLGAVDMDRAERFWSAALGYTLREKEADGRWRVLAPAQAGELGAQRVSWDRYPADPDFVVLADPEGNRFCIVDVSHVRA